MSRIDRASTLHGLNSIKECGSDLSRPLVMDFFVTAPTEHAGKKICSAVEKLGFSVRLDYDSPTRCWTCYCSQELIADLDFVFDIEELLDAVAAKYGGAADGFGTFGNFQP